MNKKTSAMAVFVFLCVVCIAHALYYYPHLPPQVARHFGVSGEPDAWGSKAQFLIVYLSVVAVLAVTFVGSCLAMPKMPNSIINLPNKDYWLAPERRQETLDYILPRFLWFGSATLLLLFDVSQQSFQVHLGRATKLTHIWFSLAAYLLFTTAWCVALVLKFSKKGSPPRPAPSR